MIFGDPEKSCRHIFSPPFRGYAVRIVAKSYNIVSKPSWRIEFGGLDYLEGQSNMSILCYVSHMCTYV